MDIDLTSVIIGIFALATFIIPIAWYQVSEKMKTKKLSSEFLQTAKNKNIQITEFDVWGGSYGIGLDRPAKKLLYLGKEKEMPRTEVVDLSVVSHCRVASGTKSVKNAQGRTNFTDRIGLYISFETPQKAGLSLEFYNGENGKTLTGEMSAANKWSRTINSAL